MRESLINRPKQATSNLQEKVPRGRNGKKWYRFLHGRSLLEEVVYDDEEGNEEDSEEADDEQNGRREQKAIAFNCREPNESLLHRFDTVSWLAFHVH